MDWKIAAHNTRSGHNLVSDEIRDFASPTRSKIYRQMTLLSKYGIGIGPPHIKLVERGLYELRVLGVDGVRILFSINGKVIILLRAFKKKSPKLPVKEINLARSRWSDLKTNNRYVIYRL
jgi:phage-related protein